VPWPPGSGTSERSLGPRSLAIPDLSLQLLPTCFRSLAIPDLSLLSLPRSPFIHARLSARLSAQSSALKKAGFSGPWFQQTSLKADGTVVSRDPPASDLFRSQNRITSRPLFRSPVSEHSHPPSRNPNQRTTLSKKFEDKLPSQKCRPPIQASIQRVYHPPRKVKPNKQHQHEGFSVPHVSAIFSILPHSVSSWITIQNSTKHTTNRMSSKVSDRDDDVRQQTQNYKPQSPQFQFRKHHQPESLDFRHSATR
jgi:hypothetical protein